MRRWIIVAGLGLALAGRAAEKDYVLDAMDAVKAHKTDEALKLVAAGLAEHPKESRLFNVRAQIHQMTGDTEAAEQDLTAAITVDGTSGWLFQERAQLRFRLGRIGTAVADFDRANELAPKHAPENWQRGIALYYAGRYADGRKQFELHRTVNPEDVENAIWHFICVARESGLAKARAQLIPIEGDTRVPMKQIHALFAGKGEAKAVVDAAEKGADNATIRTQLFYAHLYLALYYDVMGDRDKVDDNLRLAKILADPSNYMGIVARVHADRLANLEKKP